MLDKSLSFYMKAKSMLIETKDKSLCFIEIQWGFIYPGSDSPEILLVRTKVWEPISTPGIMGDSVIPKTHLSGSINQEQMCPDKRIITV